MKISITKNQKAKYSDALTGACIVFVDDTYDHFAFKYHDGVIYFSSRDLIPRMVPNEMIRMDSEIEIIKDKEINVTFKV